MTTYAAQAQPDDGAAGQEEHQQKHKAHDLTDGCGQRRAACAHVQREDEQGIEHDIQHAAQSKPPHGERRFALGAERVVQHERGAADRRDEQDPAGVGDGIGKHGVRAFQRVQDRLQPARQPQPTTAPARMAATNALTA